MVAIIKNLISGLPKKAFRNGIGKYEGVVAHSTATPEAPAINIRNFEGRNWNSAFVHFAVDWDGAIQIADTNYVAWHCGSGGNPRFVGVELCETADPTKFQKSYQNYVQLLAQLLKNRGLNTNQLYTHADITKMFPKTTTHQDPVTYLAKHGVSIAQLKQDVQNAINGNSGDSTPYKVIIPNTAFWQAKGLVIEFQQRGFTCNGVNLKLYGANQEPQDNDPYQFVLHTDLGTARELVIELQTRGYDRTYGEKE